MKTILFYTNIYPTPVRSFGRLTCRAAADFGGGGGGCFTGRDGRVRRRRPVRLDGHAVGAAAARRQPVEVAVRDVRAQAAVAAPLVGRHDDGDAHLVAIDVVHVHLDRRVEVELALVQQRVGVREHPLGRAQQDNRRPR